MCKVSDDLLPLSLAVDNLRQFCKNQISNHLVYSTCDIINDMQPSYDEHLDFLQEYGSLQRKVIGLCFKIGGESKIDRELANEIIQIPHKFDDPIKICQDTIKLLDQLNNKLQYCVEDAAKARTEGK